MNDGGDVVTDIEQRWEMGIPHDPRSVALAKKIAELDLKFGGDALDLKFGGDGDNGEHLLYLLDIMHELEHPTASDQETE